MEITREYLERKLTEYKDAEANNLAVANANHGAAMAIEDLLRKIDEQAGAQELPRADLTAQAWPPDGVQAA